MKTKLQNFSSALLFVGYSVSPRFRVREIFFFPSVSSDLNSSHLSLSIITKVSYAFLSHFKGTEIFKWENDGFFFQPGREYGNHHPWVLTCKWCLKLSVAHSNTGQSLKWIWVGETWEDTVAQTFSNITMTFTHMIQLNHYDCQIFSFFHNTRVTTRKRCNNWFTLVISMNPTTGPSLTTASC